MAWTLTADLDELPGQADAWLARDRVRNTVPLTVLDRMREILRSDTAAVLMLEEYGGLLLARAAKGIEEEVEQGVRIPVGRGFAAEVMASTMEAIQQRRIAGATGLDDAEAYEQLATLLVRGLRS